MCNFGTNTRRGQVEQPKDKLQQTQHQQMQNPQHDLMCSSSAAEDAIHMKEAKHCTTRRAHHSRVSPPASIPSSFWKVMCSRPRISSALRTRSWWNEYSNTCNVGMPCRVMSCNVPRRVVV